jgi:hypothetical protein
VRRATRLAVLEDASTHDVASWGTATERTNDFGAKMIGVVCQGLSASDARHCQGAGNGYEQRETTNEIESFLWGRRRVTRRPYSAVAWITQGRGVSPR